MYCIGLNEYSMLLTSERVNWRIFSYFNMRLTILLSGEVFLVNSCIRDDWKLIIFGGGVFATFWRKIYLFHSRLLLPGSVGMSDFSLRLHHCFFCFDERLLN